MLHLPKNHDLAHFGNYTLLEHTLDFGYLTWVSDFG